MFYRSAVRAYDAVHPHQIVGVQAVDDWTRRSRLAPASMADLHRVVDLTTYTRKGPCPPLTARWMVRRVDLVQVEMNI